ncbi:MULTISPECIES: helix-turn-helix domain-containing protein [unclassified Pseudomonas]|uniref:winged helix-turn-helix transcriptional regulator n=1 Tax=unclassified Pseudomonas TaxID=196821 RepID=UPI000BC7798E|nr:MULTISPECIES: helix-turn-helix domain-containing protein [unclassified Pseudomonas]PVZ20616.1 HxlR family transcriptional regulator [Pseudomonas sp. URIL14HWK12:I12]PVZ27682.1 HxlR family transcriptional regulator [Pseudomonas sp. URIL14HWK12:I10]PVZ38571.1 HxlR family transcriptional regulator [Pseudomonas sp. URIL14HWK12:I11]SNZ02828.1 transcriptional regulator, HxlR family [Pseudomonas sp. URIL14HWK12:I9]
MNMPTSPDTRSCSKVSEVFSRVGDKWSMQVVVVLQSQPQRFNDLRRQVNGVSQQMLTRTLRFLERDGLVERTVLGTSPPQVSYALTPLGRSLAEPVRALAAWALGNLETLQDNRRHYDAAHEEGAK